MLGFKRESLAACMVVSALGIVLFEVGCSEGLGPGMVGRLGLYDYSPSVIQIAEQRQFWWCGYAANPNKPSQLSDSIQYESVDMTSSKTKVGPVTVLGETPGTWDSVYLCNPKVIGGIFVNPLGDGQTWAYAMYYVATADGSGAANSIGVAFSNDGIGWKKYPQPVIQTPYPAPSYGVGQPAVYNSDQHSAIMMFYEDVNGSTVRHLAATSPDGVHFTAQGTLTANGLNTYVSGPTWGDMAYDSVSGYWYAAFNLPLRDASTTGGIIERGQYGVELYRIPNNSLLSGATPWQEVHSFDTNMTGYESNFIASFVRDQYGNINVGSYPTIEMYVSLSYPAPSWDASPGEAANGARSQNWDIGPVQWVPGSAPLALNRYSNRLTHLVTTGSVNRSGQFELEATLGHIYESPQHGATVAFYGCKNGSTDFFVSLDSACEGKWIQGKNGYGYAQPDASLNLVAIYRCSTRQDHFVSLDAKCEGKTTDELLGYVLP
jgi:hypothetical protein